MSTLTHVQNNAVHDKKIIASALIVNEHGEFLALLRAHDKSNGGTWGIPGGKKKENEGIDVSVCREVNEETGLTALKIQALMITESTERMFYDHIALVKKSDVILNREHIDYRWISSLDEWPQPAHPVTAELIQSKRPQIMAFITKTKNQPKHEL